MYNLYFLIPRQLPRRLPSMKRRGFVKLCVTAVACHLAYPYGKPKTIKKQDFVNLEYEFLFIVRSPTEYGIDPYNGRYYVLSFEGGVFAGEPKAVDLNILAAPPEEGVTRPITAAELDFIEVESERFPRLVIR